MNAYNCGSPLILTSSGLELSEFVIDMGASLGYGSITFDPGSYGDYFDIYDGTGVELISSIGLRTEPFTYLSPKSPNTNPKRFRINILSQGPVYDWSLSAYCISDAYITINNDPITYRGDIIDY